jgi:hypothetical protein
MLVKLKCSIGISITLSMVCSLLDLVCNFQLTNQSVKQNIGALNPPKG